MKTRELEQLKNKSEAELRKDVVAGRERLHALRLDLAAGKVKNVVELRELRKNIARMLTLANQKKAK